MLRLIQKDAVPACVSALQKTGTVLLAPTETVYGLLCDWQDDAAREKIYQLKHRPHNKLLAAFLPDLNFLPDFISEPLPRVARIFAENFMPGPVTLVVPDGKGSTFGFRIPDHPFILSLLRAYRKPLASTSANLSGTPAALNIPDALATLDGEPDIAVDGGTIPSGAQASTVILVETSGAWKILRPGPVSESQLRDSLEKFF